jgi:hypothetical protein
VQPSSTSLTAALAACVIPALAATGCSSSNAPAPAPSTFTYQTPSIAVAAGEERYVCYAQTLTEDLTIDRYDYTLVRGIHHLFFSRTLAPEPEGLSECDVLFRTTWVPLFVAGTGSASLQDPAGSATVLPKGTQVVLQVHLLNPASQGIDVTAALQMHRSTIANPTPVGIYAFGTERISLAPNAVGTASYDCTTAEDVESFGNFPHMHELGTALKLEVADSTGAYNEVYSRDPYSFNNQYIDTLPLSVPKGAKTRITCTYANTTDSVVTYGETTSDEMCFFVAFVAGDGNIGGCVEQVAPDGGTDAGGSCTPTANSVGIGAACTAGGNQCASGLACTSDLSSSAPSPGYCVKVGCSADSDCGDGAICCAPPAGGGVELCFPAACAAAACSAP